MYYSNEFKDNVKEEGKRDVELERWMYCATLYPRGLSLSPSIAPGDLFHMAIRLDAATLLSFRGEWEGDVAKRPYSLPLPRYHLGKKKERGPGGDAPISSRLACPLHLLHDIAILVVRATLGGIRMSLEF